MQLQETIRPDDCCLLMTFPLEKQSLSDRLDAYKVGDCCRSWQYNGGFAGLEALWAGYEQVAKLMAETCRAATLRGVTVWTEATSTNLADAFYRFKVVTLFAHWKGPYYLPGDIKAPQRVAETFLQPESPDQLFVRQLIGHQAAEKLVSLRESPQGDLVQYLMDHLNCIISQHDLSPIDVGDHDDPEEYRQYRNRQFLDNCFAGIVEKGNRLELWDDLLDVEQFVALVPETFGGVLDLTVCNSTILGHRLQFERSCRALVNRQPASLRFRAVVYQETIELLHQGQTDYVAAVLTARSKVGEWGQPSRWERLRAR